MLNFIYKHYSKKALFWILVLFLIVLLFGLSFYIFNKKLDDRWTNVFDPAFTIFGLIVPLILGAFLLDKEWKGSLEKRLTVHFKLKDKFVMSCLDASLSSEADIRNWGQQIGQQMNNGNLLSFYPYLNQKGPILSKDQKYLNYELIIYLKFDKDGKYIPIEGRNPQFSPDEYKVWFDNDSEYSGNAELFIATRPMPILLVEAKALFQKQQNEKNIPT